MAPVINGRVLFNQIPTGYPEPGKTVIYDRSEIFDPETVHLGGGFVVKTLVLSIDPYMRGKMRDPSIKSYSPAFEIGKPIYNYGVGKVINSECIDITPGDYIYGIFPFAEYFIHSEPNQFRVLKNEGKLPWSAYVGVCGMPGETAYIGWKEYAHAKAGETAYVSAGAGPVGATVIQLAKRDGLKVIASAGSEEKVKFMKEIGADVAFNYKTASTQDILRKYGPIDIYWDNVGGETLDCALEASNEFGRFIECGMISGYNKSPAPIKNIMAIMTKSLSVNGFIVLNKESKYTDQFYREIPPMVAKGQIKHLEDITEGLEAAGQAILDVQQGRNRGKKVIVIPEI